jgi:hypothetical protein
LLKLKNKIMKKIVAAFGALLFVGGVKAQTVPPVKKPTTPQIRTNTLVATNHVPVKLAQKGANNVTNTNIKFVKTATLKSSTIKSSTIKAADKNIKLAKTATPLKVAPTIKK